jgi:competence protein ComEC
MAPGTDRLSLLATPQLLFFAIGVIVPQQMAALPAVGWLAGGLLLAVVALRWSPLPLAFWVGLAWSSWYAGALLADTLPVDLEGVDTQVSGTLASLPQRRGRVTRFEFMPDRIQEATEARLPRRLRLAWYGQHPPLHAGDRWRLHLRLKRPRGFRNPGGFDFEGWLFRRGIRATGYVRDHPANGRLGPAPGPRHALQRLRQRLETALARELADSSHRGLLTALALGERGAISADQWTVLRNTGTSHLVAISGLHLGLVAGLFFTLVRRAWAGCGLTRWCAAQHAAAWLTLPAAALYAGLAGFTVPTQRALLMVGVVLAVLLLRRALAPGRALALALAGVLLLDPLAPGAVGFWLSFGAVTVILYTIAWRQPGKHRHWRWAWIQVVLGIGLAPLLVVTFQQVPLVAPLANLVAVPLVGLVLVPVVLVATLLLLPLPALGGFILELADRLLALVWRLLEAVAGWPLAQQAFAEPPFWTLLAGGIGVALLLSPRGLPLRLPGLVLLMPLFTFRPEAPAHGAAWVTMLDVGHGLAVMIRTENHLLVYDTGPVYSDRFNAGSAIIAPALRRLGQDRVDAVVVSHGDSDHAGGLAALRAAITIDRLYVGDGVRDTDDAVVCRAGTHWTWDGVEFAFLHPHAEAGGGNDGSCVLRVVAAGASLLLTGDIEAAAEQRLLAGDVSALRADVLQVPHHGSRTSSTEPFVTSVAPGIALVSSGWRNRFGLPVPEVIARYDAIGAEVIDTGSAGAIEVRLPAERGRPVIHRARERERRFWHLD